MEEDARDLLVLWFFKLAGILATLSEWVNEVSIPHLHHVFQRYLAPTWNTPNMFSQQDKEFSLKRMCKGWHLVNVVFAAVLKPFGEGPESSGTITVAAVEKKLPEIVKMALRQLHVWL